MRRLVIAIDCDDVLVRTTPFFIDTYNKTYHTNVQLKDAHTLASEVWGAEADEILARFNSFMNTNEYKELGPSTEEIEVLRALSDDHDLHVITARKEEERALTQAMLDRDLPGVFKSLDLVGWQGSKGEVCKRIGADVLVDDNARHLHDSIELGLPKSGAILFGDYPWNIDDVSHQDLTYCKDWSSVRQAVDVIANEGA